MRTRGDGLFALEAGRSPLLEGWRRGEHVGEFVEARVVDEQWQIERDPAGCRPAYFALTEGGVVVSTDSDLVAAVADRGELDVEAAVDFVIGGTTIGPTDTIWSNLSRLPAAHRLLTAGGGTVERIYRLPPSEPVARAPHAVVDGFWSTFVDCVADRADGDAVVLLSGGLDSTAIVAALAEVGHTDVRTVTFGRPEDTDAVAAKHVAEHFGFDWQLLGPTMHDFDGWLPGRTRPTYPLDRASRKLAEVAAGCRVFYGDGGDTLMKGDPFFWVETVREGRWLDAAGALLSTTLLHGLRPGVRASRRPRRALPAADAFCPPLRRRYGALATARATERRGATDSLRRKLDGVGTAMQTASFELFQRPEPSAPFLTTPFLDVRMMEYATTVALAPWFIDKEILRAALRARAPESLRRRPKTTAGATWHVPIGATSRAILKAAFDDAGPAADLVDVEACREFLRSDDADLAAFDVLVRAAAVCHSAGAALPRSVARREARA